MRQHIASEDEVLLQGLFDLLLAHPARAAHLETIIGFLRATPLLNIYRSLVLTLVADPDEALLRRLADLAEAERHPAKREIIEAAVALRRPTGRRRRKSSDGDEGRLRDAGGGHVARCLWVAV